MGNRPEFYVYRPAFFAQAGPHFAHHRKKRPGVRMCKDGHGRLCTHAPLELGGLPCRLVGNQNFLAGRRGAKSEKTVVLLISTRGDLDESCSSIVYLERTAAMSVQITLAKTFATVFLVWVASSAFVPLP